VLIHRSVLGSLERLFGHLIEVHNGAFPAWYAPVQVAVLPVSAQEVEAARRFAWHWPLSGRRRPIALTPSPDTQKIGHMLVCRYTGSSVVTPDSA
jgi:threonyl-tRNA synthetase